VAFEWNTHHIRKARNSLSPGGRPDELFFIPELHGTHNIPMNA